VVIRYKFLTFNKILIPKFSTKVTPQRTHYEADKMTSI